MSPILYEPLTVGGAGISDNIKIKKDSALQQNPFLFLFVWSNRSELLAGDDTTLSDTSLLTSELAEIVKLGAANLTVLVDLDAVDVR